jgi:hypothetical protein
LAAFAIKRAVRLAMSGFPVRNGRSWEKQTFRLPGWLGTA